MFNSLFNFFKKPKSDLVENTDPVFSHGPVLKRENRLHRSIWFYRIFLVFIGFCYFITVILFVTKAPVTITVDSQTGEVIGEYRDSSYKTRDEIEGGMKKFLEYYLSFNSKTVYKDHARAINMMSDDLSRERVDYLKKTNLTFDIASAITTSELDFSKSVIKQIKDGYTIVDLAGTINIYTHGAQPAKQPFHFVVTAKMVSRTGNDTIGLKITEIYEYD